MIAIAPIAGTSQGDYYVSKTAEDYYINGGEPPGEWFGRGADRLGIQGKVEGKDLKNLLLGFSKDGSRKLVNNAGSETRQSGWDNVFSAPKSVSVLWVMAPEEIRRMIQDAHKAAVQAALRHLEENYLFTRTGAGGRRREKVLLVAALFEHATSRAQDPLLHTHALILSCCPRANGKTGTIVSKILYEHKRELDRIYCRELGRFFEKDLKIPVKWTKGNFELPDVSLQVCSHYSKRRKQVLQHTDSLGRYSPQLARIAAAVTRPKKKAVPRKEFFEQCQAEGRMLGFGPEQVREILARSKRLEDANPKPSIPATTETAGLLTAEKAVALPTLTPVPTSALGRGSFGRSQNELATQKVERPVAPKKVVEKPSPFSHDRPSAPNQDLATTKPLDLGPKPESPLQVPPKPRLDETVCSPARRANRPISDLERMPPPVNAGSDRLQAKPTPHREVPTLLKDAASPFEGLLVRVRKLVTILPRRITPPRKRPVFGQALFRIPFTNLEVRTTPEPLFPKAPAWSPARKLLRLALVREGLPLRYRPKRLGPPIRFIKFGHLALEVRSQLLAPRAPQFSPLFGKRVKVLQLNVRPSFRQLRELRQRLAEQNRRTAEKRRPRNLEMSR